LSSRSSLVVGNYKKHNRLANRASTAETMFVHLNVGLLFVFVTLIDGFSSKSVSKQCTNYCSNDGVCLLENASPTCYCLPEWQGNQCQSRRPFQSGSSRLTNRIQTRSTPCSFVPDLCKNQGVCYVNVSKLACQCPYPWDGPRCEERSGTNKTLSCPLHTRIGCDASSNQL
jgi:hypothetical protein